MYGAASPEKRKASDEIIRSAVNIKALDPQLVNQQGMGFQQRKGFSL
jgi:hypothetical protein